MALIDVVRNAVKIADKVTKSFQGPVSLRRWNSRNAMGDISYDAAIYPNAVVDLTPAKVKGADGIEINIRARVYIIEFLAPQGTLGRVEPIDPQDILVLPGLLNAKIINSPGIVDPGTTRRYFHEVLIG